MEGATAYKALKEGFVSGMTGSSVGHINMISCVALASIALHSTLRTRLPPQRTIHFPAEFLILVAPLLLSVTLFANSPGFLLLVILIPTSVLLLIPRREAGTPLPSTHTASRPPSRQTSPIRDAASSSTSNASVPPLAVIPPLPALTIYRSHMMLLTAICILAVDFPVFPRSLAKCETFGASLMDLGVGSFVFSQGVVSAIPLIKNPTYLRARVVSKLVSVTRKSLPLLVLGLLRTLSVKGVEYPEHQSEYGTHWNFFVTLALVPILQVLLHPLMVYLPISSLGLILAISHQMTLSQGGLMDYILLAPRDSWISSNKEGIISLTGYLAIHLLGLSAGTVLLPPSPSFFRRMQHVLQNPNASLTDDHASRSGSESDDDTPGRKRARVGYRRENDKTATELCSYAVVWWVTLGAIRLLGTGGGISRRVVNLPYIVWVAAFNTSFMLAYLLLDLVFFPSPLSKSIYSPTSKLKVQPDPVLLNRDRSNAKGSEGTQIAPALLEAVNRNGLVIFLIANVLTGLINLVIPTMYVSDWWAMVTLFSYAFIISAIAWLAKDRRLLRV